MSSFMILLKVLLRNISYESFNLCRIVKRILLGCAEVNDFNFHLFVFNDIVNINKQK